MKRADRAKLKKGKWVRLHWHDIRSLDEGWMAPAESENTPAPIITAGIVIRCTRKHVVVAMSWGRCLKGSEEEVATTYSIPLGVIEKVEEWPDAA